MLKTPKEASEGLIFLFVAAIIAAIIIVVFAGVAIAVLLGGWWAIGYVCALCVAVIAAFIYRARIEWVEETLKKLD